MFRCIFLLPFLVSLHLGASYYAMSIGEPIVDLIYHVEEKTLEELNLEKGGCMKLPNNEFSILKESLCEIEPTIVPGGCSANTVKGLSALGQTCRFVGKMGRDPMGEEFLSHMQKRGVATLLFESETQTTQVISMVTPDGQRTMRCCFGASNELTPGELHPEHFEGVKHVHFEGYLLYNKPLLERAMGLAKGVGASISLDLACFEVVNRFREEIAHLLTTYVDIVFANEDEARALSGLNPNDACMELQRVCPVAVVLVGPHGCFVGHNDSLFQAPAPQVAVVDTTGAGDLFASGFLHGYLEGYSLKTCAEFGNLTGSTCVQHEGAEIPEKDWDWLREMMPPKRS